MYRWARDRTSRARFARQASGAGAALLALAVALIVALTIGVVGLGSTSPAGATVADTTSTATATATATDTTSPTDTPTATDTTTPSASPTATEPPACVQADKRSHYNPADHGAGGHSTGALLTKPIASDSLIYVDVRNTQDGVVVAVGHSGEGYTAQYVVNKKEDCRAFTLAKGCWTVNLMGVGSVDRYTICMHGVPAPKLATFHVRHIGGKKFRVVWTVKHATSTKILVISKATRRVLSTAFRTTAASGGRTISIASPRRKLLRVVVRGSGGKLVKTYALPAA